MSSLLWIVILLNMGFLVAFSSAISPHLDRFTGMSQMGHRVDQFSTVWALSKLTSIVALLVYIFGNSEVGYLLSNIILIVFQNGLHVLQQDRQKLDLSVGSFPI